MANMTYRFFSNLIRRLVCLEAIILLFSIPIFCIAQDSTNNNLVHQEDYKLSKAGDIPYFTKKGKGSQTIILIPGCGFDASVFNDFMEANKKHYQMYAITIPGYGNTMAQAMPPAGTSYGKQSWNSAVVEGLIKLIKKENLNRPIIAGHFVQGTQLALRMAIDHPEHVGGVIILGGPAKFIAIVNGKPQEFPLNNSISYVDNYTAPKWFKTITKEAFDQGNYLPIVYSMDSTIGTQLWTQSASIPLPVMIQYLCEFFASDIKLELQKIKCPVLVLRAGFNDKVLNDPINNYLKPQFIDSWNDTPSKNSLIRIIDVPNAASFVWKDNPDKVFTDLLRFLKEINLR